jgi:hypothetical protein
MGVVESAISRVRIKMPPLVRRLSVALLVLAAAAGLAACGNKPQIRTTGETEGTYLNLGPLVYQVQLSRQLNPKDIEDQTYLQGVAPAQAALTNQQTWFGVFIRVANETDKSQLAAANFSITDTQDDVYTPVPQAAANPFTYQPKMLPGGQILPDPNSVAGEGVIQGSLVLFKLPLTALDNRPLELAVRDSLGNTGRVKLDV